MHWDTLRGMYSQSTGKVPQNLLFLLDVKVSLCTLAGESPRLLTKRGSLVPLGQRALAYGWPYTLLCCRAATAALPQQHFILKTNMDFFSIPLPSFAAPLLVCVFCRLLSHRYYEAENVTKSKQERGKALCPAERWTEQKGLAVFCLK